MSDLYEDFFQSKGQWKRSRTWSNIIHTARHRRSLKKVWKTKAQLLIQHLDSYNQICLVFRLLSTVSLQAPRYDNNVELVAELINAKRDSGQWRNHPEFPKREDFIS